MIQGNEPPEIRIDLQGKWYFRGEEMHRLDIVRHLYQYLKKDDSGGYCIEMEHERCAVTVDDVPYVITGIELDASDEKGKPRILISLSDGTTEAMGLDSRFWTGDDNVMYCSVKGGGFTARFSRPAYYQFCSHIQHDPLEDGYVLALGNRSYPFLLNKP